MKIETKTENDIVIAAITGEVDGKTAPQAQAELMPITQKFRKIVLDMSGVTFLSSAGLRMMLLLFRQATAQNGKITLVGLSEEIKDTMEMTGFLKFFLVADSLEAGIASLQ